MSILNLASWLTVVLVVASLALAGFYLTVTIRAARALGSTIALARADLKKSANSLVVSYRGTIANLNSLRAGKMP